MPDRSANEHDTLLEEARTLLDATRKLAKLIDSQNQAIEDNDLETLEAVLRQKQPFIEELLKYPELKSRKERGGGSLPRSTTEFLTPIYTELETNIKTLALADRQTIHTLRERHAHMADELQSLMRGREVATYYGPRHQQPQPRIDVSG